MFRFHKITVILLPFILISVTILHKGLLLDIIARRHEQETTAHPAPPKRCECSTDTRNKIPQEAFTLLGRKNIHVVISGSKTC